jgi:hypothetical protein
MPGCTNPETHCARQPPAVLKHLTARPQYAPFVAARQCFSIYFTSFGLEGFAGAAEPFAPLLPVNTFPVRNPTAKNPKYIIAAGWVNGFFNTGGKSNDTELRLFRITWTKNAAINNAKTVFKNSFIKAAGR